MFRYLDLLSSIIAFVMWVLGPILFVVWAILFPSS